MSALFQEIKIKIESDYELSLTHLFACFSTNKAYTHTALTSTQCFPVYTAYSHTMLPYSQRAHTMLKYMQYFRTRHANCLRRLLARLLVYNATQVPVVYPPDDPNADPALRHGIEKGCWGPWRQ